jgi:predicted Zn-dependent peptidase
MQAIRKSIFILSLAVLTVFPAFAQQSWDEIEYPELNSFEKPDVEFFELDNGIRFYLVEDDELPLINLRALVRTGGVLVPNEKAGLQSITGTVMRSGGTTSITGDELNELLEDRAARMETGIGLTSGSASMNVLKEDFDELLPVYLDLLQNPAFPEDRLDLAKTQQKTAISRRNDETLPIGVREFQKLIYGPESVYARTTEYETIDNITREDLVEFHEKSFVGENMMIGVIGDFEMDEMKQKLTEAFQGIPAGSETELQFPEINYEFVSTINFVDKSDVNQSFVMMGHIGGMRENPDYAKIQVLNRVLSDGFSGRLLQVVRSQMGLAYSVFGQYGSGNFFPGIFYAGVMTQSETTAEAINAIIGQIERLQNEPITEKELRDTKDRFLNSLVFEYDSRASVLNEQMSFDYAGLPDDTFDRLVEEIQQVTIEDVQEAAQKYMQPENLQILVVGNGEEIGDQLQQFGEVNEIDITIPQPGDEEEVVAGDRASGAEWMERMAAAVLPGGGIDGEFTFEAANEVNTPQGAMTLNVKQTANFESETLVSEVQTPMANVTMIIEDGEGTMVMGGNEMPMPPAQRDQVLAEFYRSHVYLALNRESLDAEYMGMADMDGESYAHVRINDETTLNLYLDPDTGLPAVTTYRQFNPQIGGNSTVKVVSTNWTEVDGVVVPYETTVYTDDEVSSVTTISTHSVE